jgi:arylsulfatase
MDKMMFILLASILTCCATGEQKGSESGSAVNVILVMTDDQGYGDLSCHGNPVLKTPNLDQLYTESVRFTDFHVAPMCTPTRSQLLTGRDAMDNGATFVCLGRSMMRRELPTLGDLFTDAGYLTALFGKWHLGDSYPHRPMDRGFQEVVRHGAWGITSIADYFGNDYFDDTYKHNGVHEVYTGYCTDVWFSEAMTWMKARQRAGEHFFCYIPTNVPHVPHWVADSYSAPYENKGPAKFYGMIANLDENIGRLEKFLEDTGLRENTLLLFMTDNGTAAGEEVFNAGMRGKKRSLYEGGHRVPLFVRWPEAGIGGGRDISFLTHCQDLFPTLADLCGIEMPGKAESDGVSLATLLRDNDAVFPDSSRMLVVQYGSEIQNLEKYNAAILWKKWRLVHGDELYRVDKDPGQQDNLIEKHPDIAARLLRFYEQWWLETYPEFEKIRYIDLGTARDNPMMLYSSDWQSSYADNFQNLAAGDRIGAWNVDVKQEGTYTFTLWRWPPEANTALDAGLEGPQGSGSAVPIREARIRIGPVTETQSAPSGTVSVSFSVDLPKGKQVLQTWFNDEAGTPLCSAYYVRMEQGSIH